MAIDALSVWKTTFAALPRVDDISWAASFATWVDDRVTAKAALTDITTAKPPFTFDRATFQTELEALSVTSFSSVGATNFANAWETAMNNSLVLTVVANDFTGGGGAANTWSVVTTALIDAASVTSSKATLISALTSAPVCSDALDSEFPQIFRNAFLALTGTVDGLNSLPIPTPLTVVSTPLI
jgi:hypothetical protein